MKLIMPTLEYISFLLQYDNGNYVFNIFLKEQRSQEYLTDTSIMISLYLREKFLFCILEPSFLRILFKQCFSLQFLFSHNQSWPMPTMICFCEMECLLLFYKNNDFFSFSQIYPPCFYHFLKIYVDKSSRGIGHGYR